MSVPVAVPVAFDTGKMYVVIVPDKATDRATDIVLARQRRASRASHWAPAGP